MTYDHELTLISYEESIDEIGNIKLGEERKAILCKLASIGRSEFYNAAAIGLKPEIKFIIHEFEYEGERDVIFQGEKYKIIRTYKSDRPSNYQNRLEMDELELTCERMIGHG